MYQNRFQYLSLSNGNNYFVSVHGGEFIDHVRAHISFSWAVLSLVKLIYLRNTTMFENIPYH